MRLRFLHGKEDREICIRWSGGKYLFRFRWLPWREEGSTANWSDPVTVTVFKKGKDGGPRETVRYMSPGAENAGSSRSKIVPCGPAFSAISVNLA